MKNKPIVFVSHVSENLASAQALYGALREQALVRPWMASEDMEGGDKWEKELKAKVKGADFFVPLISQKYNAKKGKAQSEVKWALEKESEMPAGEKFIIPIGLRGSTERHPDLRDFHMITGHGWAAQGRP